MKNVAQTPHSHINQPTTKGQSICGLQIVTLVFQIGGTPCLLIILFFATFPNLIQHFPFIDFGELCEPLLFCQTPCLKIHVHSRQPQREAQAKPQNCFLYMLFHPHHTKLFSDYNEARRSMKRRTKQKNLFLMFFMLISPRDRLMTLFQ